MMDLLLGTAGILSQDLMPASCPRAAYLYTLVKISAALDRSPVVV